MTDYLTRNQHYLEKLQNLVDPLIITSGAIGESSKNRFAPISTVKIEGDQETYVGMKFPIQDIDQRTRRNDFYQSLANATLIAEEHPELLSQLPLFYALVVDSEEKVLGMMTQDFSEGGSLDVVEYADYPHANIPDGIVNLFDPFFKNKMTELEHMLFYVNGERKIGDLDHVIPKSEYLVDWAVLKSKAESEGHVLVYRTPTVEELFVNSSKRSYAHMVLEACQNGPKDHQDLISIGMDSEEIELPTEMNLALNLMGVNRLINSKRDEDHPFQGLVFSLPE